MIKDVEHLIKSLRVATKLLEKLAEIPLDTSLFPPMQNVSPLLDVEKLLRELIARDRPTTLDELFQVFEKDLDYLDRTLLDLYNEECDEIPYELFVEMWKELDQFSKRCIHHVNWKIRVLGLYIWDLLPEKDFEEEAIFWSLIDDPEIRVVESLFRISSDWGGFGYDHIIYDIIYEWDTFTGELAWMKEETLQTLDMNRLLQYLPKITPKFRVDYFQRLMDIVAARLYLGVEPQPRPILLALSETLLVEDSLVRTMMLKEGHYFLDKNLEGLVALWLKVPHLSSDLEWATSVIETIEAITQIRALTRVELDEVVAIVAHAAGVALLQRILPFWAEGSINYSEGPWHYKPLPLWMQEETLQSLNIDRLLQHLPDLTLQLHPKYFWFLAQVIGTRIHKTGENQLIPLLEQLISEYLQPPDSIVREHTKKDDQYQIWLERFVHFWLDLPHQPHEREWGAITIELLDLFKLGLCYRHPESIVHRLKELIENVGSNIAYFKDMALLQRFWEICHTIYGDEIESAVEGWFEDPNVPWPTEALFYVALKADWREGARFLLKEWHPGEPWPGETGWEAYSAWATKVKARMSRAYRSKWDDLNAIK